MLLSASYGVPSRIRRDAINTVASTFRQREPGSGEAGAQAARTLFRPARTIATIAIPMPSFRQLRTFRRRKAMSEKCQPIYQSVCLYRSRRRPEAVGDLDLGPVRAHEEREVLSLQQVRDAQHHRESVRYHAAATVLRKIVASRIRALLAYINGSDSAQPKCQS